MAILALIGLSGQVMSFYSQWGFEDRKNDWEIDKNVTEAQWNADEQVRKDRKKESDDLAINIRTANAEFDAKNGALIKSTAETEAMELRANRARDALNDYENQKRSALGIVEAKTKEAGRLDDQMEDLGKSIVVIQKEVLEATNRKDHLERDVEALVVQRERIAIDLNDRKKTLTETTEKVVAAFSELTKNNKQLEDMRPEWTRAKAEIAEAKKLEAEVRSLNNDKEIKETEQDNLSQRIKMLEQNKAHLDGEINDATTKLVKVRKDLTDEQTSKDALVKSKEGLAAEVARLEQQKVELSKKENDLADIEKTLARTKGELAAAQKEKGQLDAQVEALEKQVTVGMAAILEQFVEAVNRAIKKTNAIDDKNDLDVKEQK